MLSSAQEKVFSWRQKLLLPQCHGMSEVTSDITSIASNPERSLWLKREVSASIPEQMF